MGLFNRKKVDSNKLFTTEEMLKILSQKKYQNYTSEGIETRNGMRYKLITRDESRQKEQKIRSRTIY